MHSARLLGLSILLGLMIFPALAHADRERFPWPGQGHWLGHTGPRIGVQVQSMTPELREFFSVDPEWGVLVSRVDPDSPAAKSGVLAGDVIVAVGDKPVAGPRDLIGAVQGSSEDEVIEILLSRRGQEQRVAVTPRADSRMRRAKGHAAGALHELQEHMQGLEQRLKDLEEQLRRESKE